MRTLIIIGAGGAGLEALWVARRVGDWRVLGFADDAASLAGKSFDSLPVLGTLTEVIAQTREQEVWFHCAIGNNLVRKRVVSRCEEVGLRPATLIDPSAIISPSATIGIGSYVAPFSFVGPEAAIGKYVLINVGASVGHHSRLSDFGQVCPGARISGNVVLGEGAFVGSNGVITPGIEVGAWATIAAASLAARSVPAHCTAIGVPAKTLAPSPPE
jgi:sugar O-acyltransferase (sialic acid O-acetyltransferase NeuD family)